MSARQAALRAKNQIKKEPSTYHDFNEHCDFCVLSFQTRPELKAHIFTHFKKKTCLKTQKTLLLIADDWFEIHINDCCVSEPSELCDSGTVAIPVQINDLCIKQEENLDINGLDNSCAINDETNNMVDMKTESESDTEMNFDANSSENWSEVGQVEHKKLEPTSENTKSKASKVVSLSSSATKRKVQLTTKKKSKPINGTASATKSIQTISKRKTKCRICNWNFTQDELLSHLQSRHVPKINPIPTCETCGKTFSTPGNLRSHQYLHAERGRYICNYCGKEFVRNANLKEHINLHTGARPFVCEICKKTFHRETLLRNHRRVHTGEKKYRCNIENCERAYMFDIDLKRHKFSAHGIYFKKHICFICSKVFSENKLLKKHLEAH